jgi:hypothetical protein
MRRAGSEAGRPPPLSGRNILAAAAVFVVTLVLIQGGWIGVAAVRRAAPGAAIPDMLFTYAPDSLAPMFAALGEAGRRAYLSMNAVDFFFAASYGSLLVLTLGWIAGRLFPVALAPRLALLTPLLGALADEIENLVFRNLALDPSTASRAMSGIASAATTAKWVFLIISCGLAMLGLVASAISAWSSRRRSPR